MHRQRSRRTAALAAVCAIASVNLLAAPQRTLTPQAAVDRLLSAERTFAAASGKTPGVAGLVAMFASDVWMPSGGAFVVGVRDARAALRREADADRARVTWAPIRAGISADGRHGFTAGYVTTRLPNGSETGGKYLAYWVQQARGWRIIAYRLRPRPAGPVSIEMMPPALPAAITTSTPDGASLERYHESLDRTERAFSTEAQRLGLGPAFAKYGAVDALNMGGPQDAAFVVGAEAIGAAIGAASPGPGSPVSWGPDRVIVASSGDLGITFGMIRANAPRADGTTAPPQPFFTIWRRASINDPWRYVAE